MKQIRPVRKSDWLPEANSWATELALCFHRKTTVKSPQKYRGFTVKSPQRHRNFTVKSPQNHREFTVKSP